MIRGDVDDDGVFVEGLDVWVAGPIWKRQDHHLQIVSAHLVRADRLEDDILDPRHRPTGEFP